MTQNTTQTITRVPHINESQWRERGGTGDTCVVTHINYSASDGAKYGANNSAHTVIKASASIRTSLP